MSTKPAMRALQTGLALLFVAGVLVVLRPWTVVPIESTAVGRFDPDDYVGSVWASRVLPVARASAVDLQTFIQNESRTGAGFVGGTATVTGVDRSSRVGLAHLRLAWAIDGQAAAIQIGPVLRGTALRDALDFIRFTDFVNQLEFAAVANALNQRVVTDVLGVINVDGLAGREITFVGAAATAASGSTLEIVPVELRATGETP